MRLKLRRVLAVSALSVVSVVSVVSPITSLPVGSSVSVELELTVGSGMLVSRVGMVSGRVVAVVGACVTGGMVVGAVSGMGFFLLQAHSSIMTASSTGMIWYFLMEIPPVMNYTDSISGKNGFTQEIEILNSFLIFFLPIAIL